MTLNASRLQPLTGKIRFYVAVTGQYAWSPLLSSEQFGFGGEPFGRAYDSSELTGDNGMAGMTELRYSVPEFIPHLTSEAFAFWDLGRVWDHDATGDAENAASAGIGLRVMHENGLSGSLTLAQPLTRDVSAPSYGHGDAPGSSFR